MTETMTQPTDQAIDLPNESKDTGSSADTVAPPKDETPSYKGTKHKLKIYNQEREVDYDDLLGLAQKGEAADIKFQEASKLMKEVESFRSNPFAALKESGATKQQIADFAAKILEEQLQYDGLSESEKRALQLEEENKSYKQKLEEQEKARTEYEQKIAEQRAVQEIDTQLEKVLSNLGRKPTPKLVARIAEQMLAHLDSTDGQETLDAQGALERADHYFQQELEDYYESVSAEDLWSNIPEKAQKGIKKFLVQQAKESDPMGVQWKEDNVKKMPTSEKKGKPQGTDDWFNKIEQKLGG